MASVVTKPVLRIVLRNCCLKLSGPHAGSLNSDSEYCTPCGTVARACNRGLGQSLQRGARAQPMVQRVGS